MPATVPPRPLLSRVQSNQLDLSGLWGEEQSGLYRYAAGMLRDPGLAEDCVVDVFEHALRAQDKFRARRGSPAAWLWGIARNRVADARRQQARAAQPALTQAPELGALDPGVSGLGERERVRAALAQLSEQEQELLILRYWADLPLKELASLLDCSVSVITTRLSRAQARLAPLLEENHAL